MNCPLCGRFMNKEYSSVDSYNKEDIIWWVCRNHTPVFRKPECVPYD